MVYCLHGHSGLPIIFNRCKYDRIFPWPVIIIVTFGLKFKFTASLLSTIGKNSLVIAPFVVSSHWRCHFLILSFRVSFLYSALWYPSVCYIVDLSCLLRKTICYFVSENCICNCTLYTIVKILSCSKTYLLHNMKVFALRKFQGLVSTIWTIPFWNSAIQNHAKGAWDNNRELWWFLLKCTRARDLKRI